MRAVLDTNVWLSAIFWEGEAYKLIRVIQRKKIEIVVTKKILLEIIDVLKKEAKFQKFIIKKGWDLFPSLFICANSIYLSPRGVFYPRGSS